jgi:hypothetical protein
MTYAPDIEARIDAQFKDGQRVRELLSSVAPQKEEARILRCILVLSDSDYDSVAAWVKKANTDYRDLIWYAEYDNREVRKYDFARSFDEQVPYSYPE